MKRSLLECSQWEKGTYMLEGVVQGCHWVCAGIAVLLMCLYNKEPEIVFTSISLPILVILLFTFSI